MPKTPLAVETVSDTPTPAPRKRGGKPVAVERHTVVTEWAEEKKIDNKPKPAARKAVTREPEVEADEDEIDEIYSDLPDDLALFLQNNSGQREVTMEVREIPGPRTDVSPGIRAGIYHANHRFDVDTHQDDLALHYAKPDTPTRFMLRLKCGGQYVPNGTIFPVDVIGASVERKLAAGVKVDLPAPIAAVPAVQLAPPAVVQPPPINEDELFDKQLARLEKMDRFFRRNNGNHEPPPSVQAGPIDPKMAVAQYVMEHPDLAKQAINNLIGGEVATSRGGIGEMLVGGAIELMQSIAPTLAPSIANWFNSQAYLNQLQAQQLQQQAGQQNGAPPSLPEAPQAAMPVEAPSATEPQVPAPNAPTKFQLYVAAFATILEVRQLPPPLNQPHKAARALMELVRFNSVQVGEDEFVSPFDDVVDDFIAGEPGEILSLAETFAPHASETIKASDAPQWLAAVQDEIRKAWAQDDNEQS